MPMPAPPKAANRANGPEQDRLRYLPIFLDLDDRLVLVLGGGEAAAAKVAILRRAGASVRVVAEHLGASLGPLAQSGEIDWQKAVAAVDLDGVALLIDAANEAAWTVTWLDLARGRGVPINAVDRPEACDFIFPAILDRSPVIVAISTGGAAPALARWLRQRLETTIPPGVARLASLLGEWRERVRRRLPDPKSRRRFWDEVLDQLDGSKGVTEAVIEQALADAGDLGAASRGSVDLVGAGPGAADLLTLRAADAIRRADVILYDHLVGADILALARREAALIEVGKRAGSHSASQAHINEQLLAQACAGKRVVRLKGGDPFVFGRGGEEMLYLRRHGIEVRVIPGITAALGCAASLSLPVTYRNLSRGLHLVTGHQCANNEDWHPNWARLVKEQGTLAIYMGRNRAGDLCKQLIDAGLSPDMPVAAVENGTLANERHCFATLGSLPVAMAQFNPAGPTLLFVGPAVALAPGAAKIPVRRAAAE